MSDSLFNWSLKKTVDAVPDNFTKARIKIIYTIILFSLLKGVIVAGVAIGHEQQLQTVRVLVALVFYTMMLKVLLSWPNRLTLLAHTMIVLGLLIVWSNVFVYAHKVNIITLQFIFMIILSSFYTLGTAMGIVYSIISIAPVVLILLFGGNTSLYFTNGPQEIASPGFEIIIILNFISISVAHYLFFKAFHISLEEKEKLNQQLQSSIAEANKLAESKSNFLSTMSHELRTPLNSVVGITELMLEDNPKEQQRENLKILQLSASDLLSLINNILDFNKIDSDKLILEEVPFNLFDFVRNACAGLKIKAQDKFLEFIVDIDPQLEKTNVICDPTRLSQVIYNLVGNAIKFTDKGSITIKLECINLNEQKTDIKFSVIDTGIGIHPDKHQSIFELFTQAESHITRRYGGTGLGLAIVKQVLSLFHSSLHLESMPGKGAKFSFILSLAISREADQAKSGLPIGHSDFSNLKILVAEDNDLNRLIMKKQLDKLNIISVMVENGQLAYEACLADNYDAIFMDLHMPVLDGHEATRQIRALADLHKSQTYIVAFTASVTEENQIVETGFNDHLYKPVNTTDLYEKLEIIAALKNKIV